MLLDSWSALCTVYSSCFLFVSNPTFSVCFALEMEGFRTETICFPARCCAQKKMVLQWSRRCCNTCKPAWNVKFLLANFVILLRTGYKNKIHCSWSSKRNCQIIEQLDAQQSRFVRDAEIRYELKLVFWISTFECWLCCEASGVENEDQQGLSVGFILLWRSWKNHLKDQIILVYPGLLLWFGKFPC